MSRYMRMMEYLYDHTFLRIPLIWCFIIAIWAIGLTVIGLKNGWS